MKLHGVVKSRTRLLSYFRSRAVIAVVVACAGIGLAACSRAKATATSTTSSTIPAVNPGRVLDLSLATMRAHGFILDSVEVARPVSIGRASAIKMANSAFPSRVEPKRYSIFLSNYTALNPNFTKPIGKAVLCWVVVIIGSISGLPYAGSTSTGTKWAIILINAESGTLQGAFNGKSQLGH
jgi:hypothetical protein